jgi:quercetin dioxygenase-like cupin family protein
MVRFMPLKQLTSAAHQPATPVADPVSGWGVGNVFRGKTAGLRSFAAHTSLLDPGRSAHPPHSHPGEEVCVVAEGRILISLPEEGDERELGPGEAAFVPDHHVHSIESVGTEPALYHIIRWLADPAPRRDDRRIGFCAVDARHGGTNAQPLLDGETTYLERLRWTRIELGERTSLGPHTAALDSVFVVLDGEVESAGTRVGARGMVVGRAGEPLEVMGARATTGLLIEAQPRRYPLPRRLANSVLWYTRRTPLRRPMVPYRGSAPA